MHGPTQMPQRRAEGGHAVIEMAFLMPWVLFLFAGTFDLGFCEYSLIATQNAARGAAMYTSQGSTTAADSTTACTYAVRELAGLPGTSGLSTCGASPVVVTDSSVTGPDGARASQVSVTYTTFQLIPIPGLSVNYAITRTAEMRLQT